MKLGIIGKRFSGKTTLFEAISEIKIHKDASIFTISSVKVKDKNIDELSIIYKPLKTTYAEFDILDYNRNLDTSDAVLGSPNLISRYRELDALLINIGVIEDFVFVKGELDDILNELFISDISMLEAKIQRLKKAKFEKLEMDLYESLLCSFENSIKPDINNFTKEQQRLLSTFQFFALKPWIISINVSEDILNRDFKLLNYPSIIISAEIEKEISFMDDKNEVIEFMKDFNIKESIKDRLVLKLYETLNLISFYTVGSDEVRAWSIVNGSSAHKAAGKIHSDIERGFIKAETMSYDDFIKFRDDAKSMGLLRSEGKEYIVKTGDIINFKFNV